MKAVRWGILATGKIAHAFAAAVREVPGAELAAVGSRDAASAERFAERYRIARHHPSYEALAADPRGNGYVDEAEEVGRCPAAGRGESELMPHADSLAIAETLDRIRRHWGLRYPLDGEA